MTTNDIDYIERRLRFERARDFEDCIDAITDDDVRNQINDMIVRLTAVFMNELKLIKNEQLARIEATIAIGKMVINELNIPRRHEILRDVPVVKG